jgi:predicted amidohydrolase
VFSWGPWTVSPFLCYDLRFPSLFQEAVGMGADLLIVMANWPGPRTSHWEILLRARAVEAQCVVAGVNRCGSDPLLAYAGASLVADQSGHIIASAGQGEGLVACRPDHEGVTGWRASFPAWKTYTTTLRG